MEGHLKAGKRCVLYGKSTIPELHVLHTTSNIVHGQYLVSRTFKVYEEGLRKQYLSYRYNAIPRTPCTHEHVSYIILHMHIMIATCVPEYRVFIHSLQTIPCAHNFHTK